MAESKLTRLGALRYWLNPSLPDAVICAQRPDQAIACILLQHVCRPAGNPAHNEDRRVHVYLKAHQVIGWTRWKIEIRVYPFLVDHYVLQNIRDFQPPCITLPSRKVL